MTGTNCNSQYIAPIELNYKCIYIPILFAQPGNGSCVLQWSIYVHKWNNIHGFRIYSFIYNAQKYGIITAQVPRYPLEPSP